MTNPDKGRNAQVEAGAWVDEPGPVAGTAPRATHDGRPGTAGYWIGALVAVIATLAAIVWGVFVFLGWRNHVDDFPRLTPPGTAAVSVADTGTQFVYLEHERSTAVPPVPAITVTGPSGARVPLTAYRGEMRYDVPGVAGQVGDGVLTFQASRTGTYRVTVAGAASGTTVAIGDDLLWSWGPQVVGVVALFLGGLLAGLTLIIVTAARRSRPRY